ncbi:MAG TPA: helix-turn-helix domain-containing protein [Nevskiaceae bacterium]
MTCTSAASPRDGCAATCDWQREVSRVFVDCEIASSSRFRGAVSSLAIGPLRASRVMTTSHRAVRTRKQISADRRAVVLVNLVATGNMWVQQDGREAELRHGEFAIHDSTRPYALMFDASCTQLIFQIPRELIAARLGEFGRYTAVPVRGSDGVGRVVSRFLADTAGACGNVRCEEMARLALTAVDLLTMALMSSVSGRRAMGVASRRSALLYRAKACIAAHLREPLSLRRIAGELGISTRHLCRAFADEDSTPARYILEQRLEASRRALRYGPADQRISEIAYGHGFASGAHFCHRFRERFGMSPTEYRQQRGDV